MDKRSKVVIFGAGGHGKVVLDILLESGADVLGFIDDDKRKADHRIRGFSVFGGWEQIKNKGRIKIALGIGDNVIRGKIFAKAKKAGLKIACAIHPKAVLSKDVRVGEGVVIMPGAIINSEAVLEEGVVVNTGSSVDHDCHLKRFSQVWPGAHLAGAVRVGEFSYVGTGASVIQNLNIGRHVIIGAGAVIISDVPDNVTMVGNPGRAVKK